MLRVVAVRDDVQDLEQNSDDVDHDDGLIRLQNPIIQPAQVAMETRLVLETIR